MHYHIIDIDLQNLKDYQPVEQYRSDGYKTFEDADESLGYATISPAQAATVLYREDGFVVWDYKGEKSVSKVVECDDTCEMYDRVYGEAVPVNAWYSYTYGE